MIRRHHVVLAGALLVAAAGCSDDAEVFAKSSTSVTSSTVAPDEEPKAVDTTSAALPTSTSAGETDSVPDTSPPAPPKPTAPPTSTTFGDGPPAPGAVGFGDPYFPTYGNGGYDVVGYDINVTWQPDSDRLDGVTTITAIATDNLTTFNVDLSALEVSAVTVNGEQAAHVAKGLEVTIDPASDLPSGEEFVAEITYGGSPELQPGEAGIPGGWFRDSKRGVMVFGEPEGAASWFPVNDHPMDKAKYTLSVTAPSDLTVASNGLERSRTVNGANTTWTYAHEAPMSSYLATVVIGDYTIVDGGESTAGTPIRNVFPTSRVDEFTDAFASQPEMIDTLETWFGPYPFEVYGSAVSDGIRFGGALEVQTLSLFDPGAAFDDVIVHELAHQWYGDSVGLTKWQDIWLNEGFASYSEELWKEATEPGYDITANYELYASQLGPDLDTPPGDPGGDELFGTTVYIRGAMTLHALRLEIGDEAFREILMTWAEQYRHSSASTDQFIALAERVSGQDLTELFDDWLFQEGLPETLGGVPIGN